jgi:hypothetical protein
MAVDGRVFHLMGLDQRVGRRGNLLGFALNGLVFLVVMLSLERARSLDLRRGARILGLVVPLHLLAALYAMAAEERTWGDVGAYLLAVALLLALGPWRNRRLFLTGGLAGIALGTNLLIDTELVAARPLSIGLAVLAAGACIALYLWLLRRRRRGIFAGDP